MNLIKLTRPAEPAILAANKNTWLSNLQAAITKYGAYKAIPAEEKSQLLAHYRHADVKSSLEASSLGKCAFCEGKPAETGNIEVEHFAPKSIHHHLAFEWTNFLPSCRKCNEAKRYHDTVLEPIVNPYDQDPQDYITFEDIVPVGKAGPNKAVGDRTIEVCGLRNIRLLRPRGYLLIEIRSFLIALDSALSDLKDAMSDPSMSDRKIQNRRNKLSEAIDKVEILMQPSESHSYFIRTMVSASRAYVEAKTLLGV